MFKDKTVAVVVPAYNEESQIGLVIEAMPDFVDRIIVVNDFSTDKTLDVVKKYISKDNSSKVEIKNNSFKPEKSLYNEAEIVLKEYQIKDFKKFIPSEILNGTGENDRIILINHLKNGGVGSAIASGYKWCLDHNIYCTAVMAGDGQMDPAELASIIRPVIEENIDYVKGNRLIHRSAWLVVPKIRYFGNSILSILTKIASGYWKVSDTQCGYTAISIKALKSVRLYDIYKRYGMPNDFLVKLNIAYCTIREVEIKPVYRIGESSKMKIYSVIPKMMLLLFKLFFKRLWIKYLFRDFHPLFLLYNFSLIMGVISVPYFIKIIKAFIYGINMNFEPLLAFIFLFTSSFQSLLFAMWMDIQDNERLYK